VPISETCLAISNRCRDRDRNRKTTGLGHDKPDVYRLAMDDVRPVMVSKKIDFDTDTDPDSDRTIFRQAMCQTLIIRAGDSCLAVA